MPLQWNSRQTVVSYHWSQCILVLELGMRCALSDQVTFGGPGQCVSSTSLQQFQSSDLHWEETIP